MKIVLNMVPKCQNNMKVSEDGFEIELNHCVSSKTSVN